MSLPLPGPETVSLAARPSAIVPAGPYPTLGVEEARLLGLRDGQIVRPTLEVRNERLTLLLEGRVIEWPGSTPPRGAALTSLAAMVWVVRLSANGSAQLVPLRRREDMTGQAVPAADPAADPPGPTPEPVRPRAEGLPPRWAGLLLRPATWTAWTAALRPATDGGPVQTLASSGAAARAAASVAPPLLPMISMGLLDGAALRDAMRRCGLFSESRLARGERVDLSDVKLALMARLRSADPSLGSAPVMVSSALEDVEAAQLQSLAASTDGGLVLHLALGFRDAPPLSMRLARDPPPADGDAGAGGGWTVDIHSNSEAWGRLWLQTRVETDGRIGLVMWAEREEVYASARADVERLALLLRDEGLRLDRFQVVHGLRADPVAHQARPEAGAVLDLRA